MASLSNDKFGPVSVGVIIGSRIKGDTIFLSWLIDIYSGEWGWGVINRRSEINSETFGKHNNSLRSGGSYLLTLY